MAHRLPVSLHYATHLPALMQALARTKGRVLEMGMGLFSTPYLRYACWLAGRQLVSYENDAAWFAIFKEYGYCDGLGGHTARLVESWNDADLSGFWDVVLIDHSPDERRVVDIRRLAQTARYIVAHDSNPHHEKLYQYRTVYPLFAHRTEWTREYRQTVVLSNYEDLTEFWK